MRKKIDNMVLALPFVETHYKAFIIKSMWYKCMNR